MAVAFDAVGPSSAGAGGTASATLSWTHTAVASGVTILAGAELDNSSDAGITMTCKCDGVLMTSLGTKESDAQTAGYAQVWAISGIGSGAHTILVTASSSVTDLAGGSVSFTGASGVGTAVTGSGTTTVGTMSVAVSGTAASSLVFGFVASGDTVNSTTSPATSRFVKNLQGGLGFATGNCAGATSAGGGTVTMGWTLNSGSVPWAAIAVEVKAAIALPAPPAILFAPGWFPGSAAVTDDPGGIPFYAQPAATDATPAVIIPPTPEAVPVRPLPPGWFPGSDAVTAGPGAIPFQPEPVPLTATPPVIFPVPEVAGIADWLPLPPNWFPGASQVTTDPGSIPFFSLPQPQTPPPAPSPIGFQFLHGIGGTGAGQYFTDQNGQPYLLRWDTAWALIVNAGNSGGATTWQSDMDGYCSARAAEGFNGFLVTPTANASAGVGTFENGNTWDGIAPFSSPGVLNGAFWARVDYLLASAQANGLTVVMNVMFTYAIFNAGPLNGWTNTQFQNYGAAVGARYSSTPNLVWEVGDDYGGSWVGGQQYDAAFSAFLTGIRSSGASQLISVENESEGSSRYSSSNGQASFTWGIGNAQFNWCYTYNTSYSAVEDAYAEAALNSTTYLCVCHMDGWYDNQWNGQTPAETIELYGRKWIWWILSSGSRGAMYGQAELHHWPVNCLTDGLASASPGSQYVQPAALNTAWTTFASFKDWNLLVPDTGNALVTAGRGTRSSEYGAGAGSDANVYLGGNTYVAASITASGSLAVIYNPAANTQTITVNGSLMQSPYTAMWVDPASGAQTPATIGSTYSRSAANSAGDHDWLLVLQPAVPTAPWAGLPDWQPQPPGWFPGADRVTPVPGGIPFYVAPQPTDQNAPLPASAATATAAVSAAAAVAPAPTVADTATAGIPAAAAAAPQPSAAVTAAAGVAAVSASANAPASAATATAAVAAVLAAAPQPQAAVTATAGVAVIGAVAPGATVSTSGSANANAGVATVSAAANAPSVAATATGGVAAAAATAPQPQAAITAAPAAPAVLAVAPAATDATTATAGIAIAGAAAPGATVSTSGSTNAIAGVAAVSAAATGAQAAASAAPPAATVLAVARPASLALTANTQAAVVLATAMPPPPTFLRATSTPTVTDPRDGTATVAALATSAPSVS